MQAEHAAESRSVLYLTHELQAVAQFPLQMHWPSVSKAPADPGHAVSSAGATPPARNLAQWAHSHFWKTEQVWLAHVESFVQDDWLHARHAPPQSNPVSLVSCALL
jgi:hypothetical protein